MAGSTAGAPEHAAAPAAAPVVEQLRVREAVARRDNPLSDRWLTRPDLDAHVSIIGEEVAGGTVSRASYADALAVDAKARLADFRMVGRDPLPAGAALHYTGRHKRLELEYYRGAFAGGARAYQVVAFATSEHFAKVRGELSAMLQSFQPEREVTAGAVKTS